MGAFIDLSGEVFGRLAVQHRSGTKGNGSIKWKCVCECGKETFVDSHALRSGHTASCGCLGRENNIKAITTHGLVKRGKHHPLFSTWAQMRHRCNNSGFRQFKDYGGRGISICARWNGVDGFANFVADMSPRPEGMTLDRKDNDGDYSPENCRWASASEQHRNTRTNRLVTAFGETKPLIYWVEKSGLGFKTIQYRINAGWDAERAVTEKPSAVGRRNVA